MSSGRSEADVEPQMNADERGSSEADRQYIALCLGRSPQGLFHIAARSQTGCPAVIANHPMLFKDEQWQPFPTLYWLIEPTLNKRIADAERKGGVRMIEDALAEDPELLKDHRADNVCYAMARWALLNDQEKQAAAELGVQDMLEHSGVGGVANHDAVKCLHAQYAYHLAREEGTTVGRLMEERFGIRFDS